MLTILNIDKMAVGRGQLSPRGRLHRSSRVDRGVEQTAMQTRSTLPYANRIGGVRPLGRDWRALRAEQVTTLIVCSYSFDIDEEGAAHNRVERYINNSFIGRELPLLLQ